MRRLLAPATALAALGFLVSGSLPAVADDESGLQMMRMKGHPAGGSGGNLFYHGGVAGTGVETTPHVFLVYWGSQWNNNDPSGEAAIQQQFFSGVGGSAWAQTDAQYCQGIPSGSASCAGGTPAGNAAGALAGVWFDNSTRAPRTPTQTQLAAEAVRAAGHFGNTTAASNLSTQYVVNTATGNSSKGFGSRYCAYHTSTSSSFGNVAWTNMPYITDAGAGCGAGFVNPGSATDGITIVGGHEFAETVTDQFPSGGWLDQSGSEIGDKCAWISSGQGASTNVTLSTGTFPVQSLWSNAFGGCVTSS